MEARCGPTPKVAFDGWSCLEAEVGSAQQPWVCSVEATCLICHKAVF